MPYSSKVVRVHYNRAPIVEALIDIQVDAEAAGTSLDDLGALGSKIQETYPRASKRMNFVGRFSAGAALEATTQQKTVGHVFKSEEGKRIFQARLDGFSFSWLAPYDRWESFRDEALRLWRIYAQLAQDQEITRVAVRYINKIELPVGGATVPLEDYFVVYPNAPTESLGPVNRFLLQMQMQADEVQGYVIINQATLPSESAGTRPVLLDIDAFTTHPMIHTDSDLQSRLETLRALKNKVFEACITDKARSLFDLAT